MEIGTKATALGRRRTFVVAKFDLGGGDMKVATINIRSVKLQNTEPILTATGVDGGERDAASATRTTNGYTIVTYQVSVQVFDATALEPLNDSEFRVVVAQTIAETPGRTISTLSEDGGSVVGDVL